MEVYHFLVRQLRIDFEMDVDVADKSTKIFLHATHGPSFHFLVGATSIGFNMAAILDLQDGRHVKIFMCPISQLLRHLGTRSW